MSIAVSQPRIQAARKPQTSGKSAAAFYRQWIPELEMILDEVKQTTAPVWPLADYVAVHPFLGWVDYPFAQAHQALQKISDSELLPQRSQLAHQYHAGKFSSKHIEAAIKESASSLTSLEDEVQRLEQVLSQWSANSTVHAGKSTAGQSLPPGHICPVTVELDAIIHSQWTDTIKHEVGRFCASYYDEGQASWQSPFQHLPLYTAWKTAASIDRNLEILGVKGFRKLVSELPQDPLVAIASILSQLEVPRRLWKEFLLSQVLAMPGWFAWSRYRSDSQSLEVPQATDFIGLMAMRLSYDLGISNRCGIQPNWNRYNVALPSAELVDAAPYAEPLPADIHDRNLLLRAAELGYREQLLGKLCNAASTESLTERKFAQMVFCIDVRSERIRRHLESVGESIETFGFAGFFGVPMAYRSLGAATASSQLPVLLKPKFEVQEGFAQQPDLEPTANVQKRFTRLANKVWKQFQSTTLSCFSFIESAGWMYAVQLAKRTFAWNKSTIAKPANLQAPTLGPTLAGLSDQGMGLSEQASLAQSILKNLGLNQEMSRLVVFCGHASQTCNNPLAASLDCGACGGHGGEANARFAALLLNHPAIRQELTNRGVSIPNDTHFVAAVHNTTTDVIEWFDQEQLPQTHWHEFEQLKRVAEEASMRNRCERSGRFASLAPQSLFRKSLDWSEVRPEWGLAGNAAFVAAPRSMTQEACLDGRSFLHSYDYTKDSDGSVLELIMTAPLVVAHWINMQYYASTVDPAHYSSGSKTIHNVVGQFGILAGNGGDLGIGLPLESFHNGETDEHQPLRLLAVIAAPVEMIHKIIKKHPLLQQILSNQWMHLVAMDQGKRYELQPSLEWNMID